MGFFDFINKYKERKEYARLASLLNGSTPIFSQFGDDIYASDVVQQALYTIVCETRKLVPRHIRKEGFDTIPVSGNIQAVLDNPNELMTKSDFIEKITWRLLLNYNAFVYKQVDNNGKLLGLYPLAPVSVTFLDCAGVMWVKMIFRNGQEYTLPYSSLIHIKTHYSVDDLMGGGLDGQPNNDALLKTLSLNDVLLQGVKKALQSSFAINGIVKYNTMLDNGTMEAKIKDFEEKLRKSASGILGIDNKAEVIQFKRDISIVDEKTLAFIDDKILRHFGVPLCILRGDFTQEQHEAWYQRTLEPIVVNLSDSFTKGLFTRRETSGFENRIMFYPRELSFLSMKQVVSLLHELSPSGTLYENEKRAMFGFEPLPELVGVRLQSLNYVRVDEAAKQQSSKGEKDDEE